MDPNQEWLKNLENYSVEELFVELDNERQALQEILDYEPYEDKGRQINATRNNIRVIQSIIGKKTGSKH